jgi:hypothetical protein
MRILTWDIGGANVKRLLMNSSTEELRSDVFYFPIWRLKDELKSFLRNKDLHGDRVGITMTAELCDVFRTKKEGVESVVEACEEVFERPFYLSVEGKLLTREEIKDPLCLAASNWVASSLYLEKKYGKGVLLDVGSTTTDVIPFGFPHLRDRLKKATDLERLQQGYLVYTGFLRTPLSAITPRVIFRGKPTRISSETFAISADIYNTLGILESYRCETPDGRGKNPRDSMRRVARMLCADLKEVSKEEIRDICDYVFEKQATDIAEALKDVVGNQKQGDLKVYLCGVGIPLGLRACEIAQLPFQNLAEVTSAHENLPCLGLAEMFLGKV